MNHQQQKVIKTMLRMLSCVYTGEPTFRRSPRRWDIFQQLDGASTMAIYLLGHWQYGEIKGDIRDILDCAIHLSFDSPEVE